MKEAGKIVKIFDNGQVEIEMVASGGCGKCGLCKIGMNDKAYMTAVGIKGSSEGDLVIVETSERDVALLSIILFIVPVVLFLAGYLVYNYVLSAVLVSVYYIGLWSYDRFSAIKGRHLPYVVKKV